MRITFDELSTSRLHISVQATNIREPEYLEWLNDYELMRFSNQRFIRHTMESAMAYREALLLSGGCLLALRDIEQGNLVGTISLRYEAHHRTVDVGLLVGKGFGGTGYGTEAWNAIVRELEQDEAVRKITAGTLRANVPMLRILEQSNLQLEGIRVGQELVDDHPVDLVMFGRCLRC